MTAAEQLELVRAALPGLDWRALGPGQGPAPLPGSGVALRPIKRLIAQAERPILLVNDAARVQPVHLVEVLRELWVEGKTRLLVATGTHKGEVGFYRERLGGLPAEVHDAGDVAAHDFLVPGTWDLDGRVLAADLVVAFGSVEPHYFAGWTGAHKTATVGVATRDSVARNHSLALSTEAAPCRLKGNPVASAITAAAGLLEQGWGPEGPRKHPRRLLCVNQVLDEEGRALASAVGTWRGSLSRVLPVAEARAVIDVATPAALVVASVAGPLGHDLYQADKGIKNWEAAVAEGGDLLLCAPFPGGLGPDRFVELLRAAPDHAAADAFVTRHGYTLGDHKAVRWRALEARGVRVRVVGPLDPALLAGTGVEVFPNLSAACARLRDEGRAASGSGLFVSDAGNVVARRT